MPSHSAVASAHPLATQAGLRALNRGGNAFDAAAAVAATLAVVEPSGSGLGGGGFWLLHRAADGKDILLDSRERAPFAAKPDLYLDARGEPIVALSVDGPLAAGIPGMPAALAHLAEHYGRLPLQETLASAMALARNGVVTGQRYRRLLMEREAAVRRWPESARLFLEHGRVPKPGFRLVQKDLARTLEALARRGKAGFYEGEVAARLVRGVRDAGGIWSLRDLADYRVIEREPLTGRYGNLRITTAPPPAGGAVLLEILNQLATFDLDSAAPEVRKHLIAEAMRRAYHDRARYLGDPDYVPIPLARLLSPDYAAGLSATIRPDRVLPSVALRADGDARQDGADTSHLSIVDREGNYVAATLSINYAFGSGFVAPGTGVLLNDEMDDFAIRPGRANLYGLVGGQANAISPGKRMLSSMVPTFLDDGERVAALGTPGGSRITSMVLLATLDFAAGRGPHWLVTTRRFHHQYLPDRLEYEPQGLSDAEVQALRRLGHELKPLDRAYGNMQAVVWDKRSDRVFPASDPRGEGLAATTP